MGFLPWIAFAVSSSVLGFKAGAVIGLALLLPNFVRMVLKRDFIILDVFGFAFFIFLVITSFTLRNSDLEGFVRWSAAMSYGGLALISWATIAIGDLFTRQYARRSVPKEYWKNDLFLSSTMSMAVGWSAAFFGAFAVSFVGALSGLKVVLIQGLALGCMLLAILWHMRVMDETQAKAKKMQEEQSKKLE